MAKKIATGLGDCCCPDCLMFADNFDCCFNSIPICDYPDISMACCVDRETFATIPSRDLGGKWAWQKATGQWWKAISPIPEYTIPEGASCNDGALWEVSGNGTITSAIGFPNTGFRLSFTVLVPTIGTDLTVHAWSSIADPLSGLRVRVRFLNEGGTNVTRIEACDKALVLAGVLSKTVINVSYIEGKYVVITVGTAAGPESTLVCCNVSVSGGWKFSFTNNSGSDEYGPIPLILDDVQVDKELVYHTQPETSQRCLGIGRCSCISEKTNKQRYIFPATLKLDMYIECGAIPGAGSFNYMLHFTLSQVVPINCETLDDIQRLVWASELVYCPKGQTVVQLKWVVMCDWATNQFVVQLILYGHDIIEHFLTMRQCDPLVFERKHLWGVPPEGSGEGTGTGGVGDNCWCGDHPPIYAWVDVYE